MTRSTTEAIDPARSAQMARVRGRDTEPEMQVRRALHAAGLRFRLHAKDLSGRPDVVFRSRRVAVFVHGCFWHRHGDPECKLARLPKSRVAFWTTKLEANRERDVRDRHALEAAGWRVETVWECELRRPGFLEGLAARILALPAMPVRHGPDR